MALSKEQTALAYEIADALNDRHSIDQHLYWCGKFSKEFLLERLHYVLSKKNIENKAAYFTSIMMRHDKNARH